VGTKLGPRLLVDSLGRGFDNGSDALAVSAAHLEHFADAAALAVAEAFATPTSRMQLVGCDPGTGTCLRDFIIRLGRRAYRRPLVADEIASALTLARTVADAWAGAQLVSEAFLQSPSAILHVETGQARPMDPSRLALTGPELASRLSFLLWRLPPDDTLLDAAAAGALDTAAGVETRTRMMLDDPRGRAGLRDFAEQWLHLRNLEGVIRDANTFPMWNDSLRASMKEETRRVFEEIVWRPNGGDLFELLTAPWSFVNAQLAMLYGVPAPAGAAFARVDFRPQDERAGLLTQAAVLALSADTDLTTPMYRGMFVREALLCQPSPPPPPDIPEPPPAKPGQTPRERLSEHRSSPSCAGCHELIDGIGFGLERYDAIGVRQDRDPQGGLLTGEGTLLGATPPAFTGARELADRLRTMPELRDCLVKQVYRFALGRNEGDGQSCELTRLGDTFAGDKHDLRKLVLALVRSDVFRFVAPFRVGGQP